MTEITIQYDRKMSDGNYGSEGLLISITETFEHDPGDDALDVMVQRARVFILTELSKSEAYAVSHAAERELNPPKRQPVAAGTPFDPDEMPF